MFQITNLDAEFYHGCATYCHNINFGEFRRATGPGRVRSLDPALLVYSIILIFDYMAPPWESAGESVVLAASSRLRRGSLNVSRGLENTSKKQTTVRYRF